MGTTSRGYPYPESTDHSRIWEHFEDLAVEINDDVADLASAWTTYTPVWSSTGTAPSLGNGTLTGAYHQIGKTTFVRIVLTYGTTTTYGTGVYHVSLPVGAQIGSLLTAMYKDATSGGLRYSGSVEIINTTTTGQNMRVNLDSSTGVWGAAIPVTPASADVMFISGSYEAV